MRILTGARIFAFTFLLLGLSCVVIGTWKATIGLKAKSWPKAVGRIIISKAEPLRANQKIRIAASCISLDYIYLVGDKIYDGHNLDSGWSCFSSPKRVKEILKKYPTGKKVYVYYNPNNPSQSLLEPGLNWSIYFLWGIGIVTISTSLPMLKQKRYKK